MKNSNSSSGFGLAVVLTGAAFSFYLASSAVAAGSNNGWSHGETTVSVNGLPMHDGNATAATSDRNLGSFRRISLRSAENLDVHIGNTFKVSVTGDSNLLDLIGTRVDGDRLVVEALGSYRTRHPIHIDVTLPALDKLEVRSSADSHLHDLAGESFEAVIDGSGDIDATGSVGDVNVRIRGSGDADLSKLSSKTAHVEIDGSGDVTVNTSEQLSAVVNGSGDIRYLGSPARVDSHVHGSGDIAAR